MPLQASDFLRKLLLDIILLGKSKVTNFERHPSLIYEDIRWLDVPMDKFFLMNVLETTNQLLEIVIVNLSVDSIVLCVHELSESLSTAVLHLDHHIESDEVLLFFYQLIEGGMRPLGRITVIR